jgi:hypothetical protein
MAINYNPASVTDGLQLYLDAANPKSYPKFGINWTDLISKEVMTLINGLGYDNSNNGAMVFDGISHYVDMGSSYFISTSQPFTINIFMKMNQRVAPELSAWHRIITLRASGTTTLGIAYANTLAGGYDGLYITSNSGWVRAKTEFHPEIDKWGMLTVAYNGLGSTNVNNFSMYWNLNLLTLYTEGVTVPASTQDNNYLGVRFPGDVQLYRGKISTVIIYNKLLSYQEIKQNFNATRSRYGI